MARLNLVLCVVTACCLISLRKALHKKKLVTRSVQATTISVHNQCSFAVCPKFSSNGGVDGCSQQEPGSTWTVDASWTRMWGVTGGCGACNSLLQTGVGLTLFEITVAGLGGMDFYDISTLSGFNIAMKVVPTNGGCPVIDCRGANAGACPNGFYPGGPDETKGCSTGTDYDLYLCA